MNYLKVLSLVATTLVVTTVVSSKVTGEKVIDLLNSFDNKLITQELEIIEDIEKEVILEHSLFGIDYLWPDDVVKGKCRVRAKVFIGFDFEDLSPNSLKLDHEEKLLYLVMPEFKDLVCSIEEIAIENEDGNGYELNKELRDIPKMKKIIKDCVEVQAEKEKGKKQYMKRIKNLLTNYLGSNYKVFLFESGTVLESN